MKKSRLLCALCALTSSFANAQLVTFDYIGEVSSISDSSYFQCPSNPLSPCRVGVAGMIVGDHFQGTVTYDSDTIGTPLSPYSGTAIQYTFNGAPNTLTVDINSGYSFTNYHYSVHNDAVLSWPPDRITIGASANFPGYENTGFIMEFWSSDGDAFSSAALPMEPLILDIFDIRASGSLSFINPNNPNQGLNMDFRIVSLTAVPIPAPLYLFGSGLLGLIGIANRKKC
jgi:hypothetical protein